MKNKQFKLFCDMDGVSSDWEGRIIKEWYTSNEKEDLARFHDSIHFTNFTTAIGGTPSFFRNLEVCEEWGELWDFIEKHEPTFLSTTNTKYHHKITKEKREWLDYHCGKNHELITVPRHDDKMHYAKENYILIDDFKRNVRQWREAGGIAILHVTAEETISQLKALGYE